VADIESEQTPVHTFAERAWDEFLQHEPVWATSQGDERWDDRLDDPGPDGRARTLSMVDGWEAEMDRLDKDDLVVEDAVTIGLIRVVVDRFRRSDALRSWDMEAIAQYGGPQGLVGDLARVQRVDSPERLERLVARLEAYPDWLAAHASNLEVGVAGGRTAARPVVDRCLTQTRRIIDTPAEQTPLLLAHPDLVEADRDRIVEVIRSRVLPAQERWLAMLESYAPDARTGVGISHVPDGDALYRHHILAWTTLDEDPRDIHEFGRERLAQIESEASAIARDLGHDDISELRRFLDDDPANHASEPGDLVTLAESLIERADAVAATWFGRLPKAGCEVRPVEAHVEQEAPPAFYMPPAPDGSRKGVYYINTYDPSSRPLHRIAATTYHEAVPGHHFQIAIEQELAGLPSFRRFGARLAGGAYVEGWGLYAERLANEMGLYQTPLERFGALESEAWRAVRLIVDTGIHVLGWDRQQSIDMLRDRAGLSALEAETETDRYISWPGQALSYMIGQREIMSLRSELEARDGDRFDTRGFHDAVLAHGALPLATLRAELPRWVKPAVA
jgi:uncharacterized protein (DUF885 family)